MLSLNFSQHFNISTYSNKCQIFYGKISMLTHFIRNSLMVSASVFGSICAIFCAMIFSPPTEIFPVQKMYMYLFLCVFLCLLSIIVLYIMAKKTNSSRDMELLQWLINGLISTFLLVALLTYLLLTTFKEELL